MNIAGREIGPNLPPYIIAEVSCNHGGVLSRAIELIDAAKSCGADAVKFQAMEPDKITINCSRPEFTIEDGPWKGKNLYELYARTQTPFEWFPEIAGRAANVGITWFASVFDKTSVDLMVKLGAPALKIASFEIVDIPLIKYAASTDLPLLISTGMATEDEVMTAAEAVVAATKRWKVSNAIMLHCVSGYPTMPAEANLGRIKKWAGTRIGISDHSTGIEIPIAATALGACIIEKHFRLSWHPETEDSAFSLDETDFFAMAMSVRTTWAAMQPPVGGAEAAHRPLRRSLFAVEDIRTGEFFTHANVRSIRPGHGLPPVMIEEIIGKFAAGDIERGQPITRAMINGETKTTEVVNESETKQE